MCLLVLAHHVLPEAPLLLAANREEYFDRPALPPDVHPQWPDVVCGLDLRAGGTWLGVNRSGLLVAVTNRCTRQPLVDPPSRGQLCLDLLACQTAEGAAAQAAAELNTRRYGGANFMVADGHRAVVVHGGDGVEAVWLAPGWHAIANADVDDASDPRLRLARRLFEESDIGSVHDFVRAAGVILSRGRGVADGTSMVLRSADRGTVSSSIIVLPLDRSQASWHYAPGPPDAVAYEDRSAPLRSLWAAS